MTTIDWMMVFVPLAVILYVAWRARRYVVTVADFMAGGRVAGRYLIAVSDGMSATGLVAAVASFEYMYQSGFAVGFWGALGTPIFLLLTLSGFVIYRFRETRALTLAQFLETRYSRRFRVFAGILASVSGVLNFAIFPAIAGKFFIYFCGLPEHFSLLSVAIPTFAICMAVFLGISLLLVLSGGQLTNMVTDCIQGMFCYVMCLVVIVTLVWMFNWSDVKTALLERPAGMSMLDPFDTYKLADFNIWFVLIGIAGAAYSTMAWQGNAGANSSAASPHEAKMAKIIGTWRTTTMSAMFTLVAVCAYTYLHHPAYHDGAVVVQAQIDGIANTALQSQARVPLAMSHVMPVGVKGMFLAVMLFLMLTTDTSYLHSWGSIIVQDVVLPLRRTPLTTAEHLRWLRISIVGVAVFAFVFSLFFNQTTYILMFFALTGSIYLGGAGAVIIGGLYWRRGSTGGAWTAMLSGATIAACGFACEQWWPSIASALRNILPNGHWLAANSQRFPLNGQYVWLIAMLVASGTYVTMSLLSGTRFNLDQMLHRGTYRDAEHAITPEPKKAKRSFLGIDAEFTRGDRFLARAVFIWCMIFFVPWCIAVVTNFIHRWSADWWATYFGVTALLMTLAMSAVASVWFTVGGYLDMRKLFRTLATTARDPNDDGRAEVAGGPESIL